VVSEFQAIHMGQQDVGHDKSQLTIQRAGDGQCFFPGRGRKDNEALTSQCLRQNAAEHRVIFNNQNDLLFRGVGRHEIFDWSYESQEMWRRLANEDTPHCGGRLSSARYVAKTGLRLAALAAVLPYRRPTVLRPAAASVRVLLELEVMRWRV
jgi:hypothetical protein